jgi:hypothetical protein
VGLKQHIQYSLLAADDMDLPEVSFFFLKPPQTEGRQWGTGGSAGARNFNSYTSSNTIPVRDSTDSTDSTTFLVFCKRQAPMGHYRLWVLAATATERPGNGHSWQPADIKIPGGGGKKTKGWVDATVGLCVWEPATTHTPSKRRRSRWVVCAKETL